MSLSALVRSATCGQLACSLAPDRPRRGDIASHWLPCRAEWTGEGGERGGEECESCLTPPRGGLSGHRIPAAELRGEGGRAVPAGGDMLLYSIRVASGAAG